MDTTEKMRYPLPALPAIPDKSFLVTEFGAVPGSLTLCTASFQQAIDACSAAGGGRVIIPPGLWRTGPLRLHSRIELHAQQGALVLFEPKADLYPLVASHFEGESAVRCQAPLDGENLEDIAITGGGIFDGGGQGWRPVKRFKLTNEQWNGLLQSGGAVNDEGNMWWPSLEAMEGEALAHELRQRGVTACEAYLPARAYLRPTLLSLRGCSRVRLDGPTFQNSPAWCLHLYNCEQVTIRRLNVRNPWHSQNGDGLDLESCRHSLIEHCTFDVGDDAICLKSGKGEEARNRALPCEFVTIRHCTVYHGHGGIVIGSEMSGGVKAVYASDCQFISTDIGLRFKSVRGRGGVVEDIVMERIQMADIVREAISFHFFYAGVEGSEGCDEQLVEVTEETPVFRNITLRELTCHGAATALLINGLPELPLSGLTVDGLEATAVNGVIARYADHLKLEKLKLHTSTLPEVQLYQCNHSIVE
ncbi:glycoside hydrolase [Paenibacillus sp. BIHB 4019]|uniref:Glycoside hydrolase n=1 Tax=Paenibacillus sp. BIHB 4019 TaxID=1870819 RepID=A0A1B2DJK0_9BACL|nr:glycoside hydrolase family 28 protein [Paenibacillus sp. BIHB 4019]ANY67902.1 glycoside hydrolase [Paenibacillus sp. BIHB 4019]